MSRECETCGNYTTDKAGGIDENGECAECASLRARRDKETSAKKKEEGTGDVNAK